MSDIEITGTLRNAQLLIDGGMCLRGQIHGDTKGRFRDGEVIITSRLEEHRPGSVFKTRFSAYRVESWL